MQYLIFQQDMIKALRADRKTQTRRMRGLDEINENPDKWDLHGWHGDKVGVCETAHFTSDMEHSMSQRFIKCPYKLGPTWVRETFRVSGWNFDDNYIRFEYKDGEEQEVELDGDEGALWLADRFEKIQYELEKKGVEPVFTSEEDYHFTKDQIKKLKWTPAIHMDAHTDFGLK